MRHQKRSLIENENEKIRSSLNAQVNRKLTHIGICMAPPNWGIIKTVFN